MLTKLNHKYIHFFTLLVLSYLVLFLKIDSFHIRWWDESMFAVNTYEMIHNGKFFSLYFDNAPDLFNTKPPVTSWLQLVFVKLFGYNEMSIRLPSALAALFTVIMLFNFMYKNFSVNWAWLSSMILLTSYGFIHFHTARTGDSDSLLTLALLGANLYFIKYIFEEKESNILYFFLFVTLAFGVKMYAALLFTPAYLIVLIKEKKLKEFITNKFTLIGITVFVAVAFTLVYLREKTTPGYLQEILFKDAGRMFNAVENHSEIFTFYFDKLIKTRFSSWFIFLTIGIILSFYSKEKKEKSLLFTLSVFVLVYLFIISSSVTKLEWYDMPLFPLMAVIASYPLLIIINLIIKIDTAAKAKLLFFVIVFFYPYYTMFNKSQSNGIIVGEKMLEANERYLFKNIKEKKNLDGVNVYFTGYKGSLLFYKYKLSEVNQSITIDNKGVFQLNDKVLFCNDSIENIIKEKYAFNILDSYENAKLVQISQIK